MLPTKLIQINRLNGNKGITQGISWILEYHKILNPKDDKLTANWYIPTKVDGIVTIKKRLIFLFKIYNNENKKSNIFIHKKKNYEDYENELNYNKIIFQKEKYLRQLAEIQLEKSKSQLSIAMNDLQLYKNIIYEKDLQIQTLINNLRQTL